METDNKILVFETRLDGNGDYAGFTFYELGNLLNKEDRKAIEHFASSFYESFDGKAERIFQLSIGTVVVVGSNHPNSYRNKLIQGFLLVRPQRKVKGFLFGSPKKQSGYSQELDSIEDEKQNSENDQQKKMKELSTNWLLEMAKTIPSLTEFQQNDIDDVIKLLIREIDDSKIVLNPKILIISFLSAIGDSKGFNMNNHQNFVRLRWRLREVLGLDEGL